MKPLRLPPNQLHRFYRGGDAIARFRGTPSSDEYAPEDWVGSTNAVFGDGDVGLSRFEDGVLVRDAVAADPAGFLGPGRTETGLLVKLLDAAQRLPVHCHPDRAPRAHGQRHRLRPNQLRSNKSQLSSRRSKAARERGLYFARCPGALNSRSPASRHSHHLCHP